MREFVTRAVLTVTGAPAPRGALWHAYEILYKFEDHLTEPARYGDGTAGTLQRLRGGAVAERPPHNTQAFSVTTDFLPRARGHSQAGSLF